jgi:uncharacterized membrane protein
MHWLSLFVLVAATCVLGSMYDRLPERWVTHWGLGGQPDAWSHRSMGSVFWPLLLGAAMWLISETCARIVVRRVHDDRARVRLFRVVRATALIPVVILAATSLWLPLGTPSSPLSLIVFSMAVVVAGVLLVHRLASGASALSEAGTPAKGRGLFYNDPADERLWVETSLGFALNFGHPEARRLAGVLLLPPLLILATIAFCAWAAR